MFQKKAMITSAILAGLVSGIALAEEGAPAPAEGGKMEKKHEGPKGTAKKHEGVEKKKHKKGDKDACSGPNGCEGMDKAAKKEGTPSTPVAAPEKKAE